MTAGVSTRPPHTRSPGTPAARGAGAVPADPAASIRSLYVHIPFCERKCEYCDFTSIAGARGQHAYIAALNEELLVFARRLPGIELDTVFVGGGTPSLIEPALLGSVLDTIHGAFRLAAGAEITLEANPSSTTTERALRWRAQGFNRVSIGVQSLESDVLAFLGRVHAAGRAIDAVAEVRAAGFDSVNCDLIYAVPGLDDSRWRTTLQRVVAAGPDHVSCYELTVEPGTPLHTSVRRGAVIPVDDGVALRQHAIALDVLQRAGYAQYEVSNFALPGAECRHNLAYWHNAYYLAAGVGAHGHLPAAAAHALERPAAPSLRSSDVPDMIAVRYRHGRGIAAFCEAIAQGAPPVVEHEEVDAVTHEQERLMLGLRLRDGVRVRDARVLREAHALQAAGLLAVSGDALQATAAGERLLNAVTLRLTSAL